MAGETYKATLVTQAPTITTVSPWTPYTPQLFAATTNPSLGSGSNFIQSGRYFQLGKLIVAEFTLGFGNTGMAGGNGDYTIGLPVASKNLSTEEGVGQGWVWDVSTSTMGLCYFRTYLSTTKAFIYYTGTSPFQATHATPWVWASGDAIQGLLMYEAA
jgi:hypothetical protein